MILRVKVKKQLDCKANRKIESGQEIVSEQCSLQECGDFTWRVSDCEELVGILTGDDGIFSKPIGTKVAQLGFSVSSEYL